MLRRHMSQEIVLPQERLPHRTATTCHRTVEAIEPLHFWMHGLHVPDEIFVVARPSVRATGYSTLEVPAVSFGVSTRAI